MKKLFFLILCVSIFLVSCKQKDTKAPLIFLNGDNPMKVTLNSWWEDPGFTVDDNFDGNSLTDAVEVTHNIPINGPSNGEGITELSGSYTVTYSVKDKAGNLNTVTRTVNVISFADKYATQYSQEVNAYSENIVPDTVFNNAVSITADSRINNRIIFPKLGGKSSLRIYADIIDSDTLFISDQKNDLWESGVRYLYIVTEQAEKSIIYDTIDPYIIVKYQLFQYVKDPQFGTIYWPDDSVNIAAAKWRLLKDDNITDTYIRY